MTPEVLARVMPFAGAARAALFAAPLSAAMARWDISTPARQAAFLGNVAAETASLSMLKEGGDGSSYVGILGNRTAEEAALYVGRGPLQLTGRDNYAACGAALGLPLLTNPALLEGPLDGSQAAGWFWNSKGLNVFADRDPRAFATICERINGGFNGINERISCWIYARRALGVAP